MSWAAHRQTTRQEDEAYSLLGIFDVQIPPIYGEGRESASNRLREEIGKSANSKSLFQLLEVWQSINQFLQKYNAYRPAAPSSLVERQLRDTDERLLQLTSCHRIDLWVQAVDTLNEEDRHRVDTSYTNRLQVLKDLYALAKTSRQRCIYKRWRCTRKSREILAICLLV
jgi:hypothetical protein